MLLPDRPFNILENFITMIIVLRCVPTDFISKLKEESIEAKSNRAEKLLIAFKNHENIRPGTEIYIY